MCITDSQAHNKYQTLLFMMSILLLREVYRNNFHGGFDIIPNLLTLISNYKFIPCSFIYLMTFLLDLNVIFGFDFSPPIIFFPCLTFV